MEERQVKKRRLDSGSDGGWSIQTMPDLQAALYFRQDSSHEAKQGIRRFKDFLTSISTCENTAEQASKLGLLKEYCDKQSSVEKYAPNLPDLISTWSFAAEHNDDALLSAVPALLAQFLKTISSYLEFREFGISLCRTLLQRDQVRLLDRGLSAPTSKEHVVSPCLRLLAEMVSFDGGVVAQDVFLKRDPLFKRLDVFLNYVTDRTTEENDARKRPTLRRIAQRLVLANLKYQDSTARGELILQGKIFHTCLRGIEDDGSDIIKDMLQAIDKRITSEEAIPRNLKARFLDPGNLTSVRRLYGFEDPTSDDETQTVRDLVHQFLLSLCTQPGKGLLVAQSGWYPAGVNPETANYDSSRSDMIDLGMHSVTHFDDYKENVPVKNATISTFLKTLKPEQDTMQAELLMKSFQAAPELVADYFAKRSRFQSALKDAPEWRTEFAFLFSVIQLPVPAYCGWRDKFPTNPPPLSIVIESILPRPFDRSTLTKCLNLNQEIITMSAARAITVALHKLKAVLRTFGTGPAVNNLWSQASLRLIEMFVQRTPALKDIAGALQRVPKDSPVLRGAMVQCLALYLKIMPHSAATAKFDVTKPLTDVLQSLNEAGADDSTRSLLVEELPDFLSIAQQLPNTKWWQSSTPTTSSPFISLLKFCTSSRSETAGLGDGRKLLHKILAQKGITCGESQSLSALLSSLTESKKYTPLPDTYTFIENCTTRIVQNPVRYLDMLEANQRTVSDKKPLSLLVCCVAEQWPFVAKNPSKEARKNIAAWAARYFAALDEVGENFRVMAEFQDAMVDGADEKLRAVLQKAFEKQQGKRNVVVLPAVDDAMAVDEVEASRAEGKDISTPAVDLESVFGLPSASPESIEGLDRWDRVDLEAALANGRVERLLQCTTSPEEEVRRQAYHTIHSLMQIVETSSYTFKEQLHLLLGELLETVKAHSPDFSSPPPSFAAALAALLTRILADPADKMYGKANRFLLRGPAWDADHRLVRHWVDNVLLAEPEHDDGHHLEVERLLDLLRDGLRTAEDLEVYRRAGVWERVMGVFASAPCGRGSRRRVLGVLYRAMQMGEKGEGKGMLVRRAGVLGWIGIMRPRWKDGEEERGMLDALAAEMREVEETEEVKRWRTVVPGASASRLIERQSNEAAGP